MNKKSHMALYLFLFERVFILLGIEDSDIELELCPYSYILGEFFEFFGVEVGRSSSDGDFSPSIF